MPKWTIEIAHKGLNRSRTLSGNDKAGVEGKALEQQLLWEKEWLAEVQTREARASIGLVQTILSRTLAQSEDIDWDSLKSTASYPALKPSHPNSLPVPLEPRPTDWEFKRHWNDRDRFSRAHSEWQRNKDYKDGLLAEYEGQIVRCSLSSAIAVGASGTS
jgi:hypothetical protein